ncbi:protein SGT1 homolog [Xenopus laevis]|uniref:Protein SGT1 homolog n=1 Tax=Xenopus laevis TaxID=8355 RepID=A0A8J1MFH5_XENLA|nr:protein SGT1 homolog [Xenopus laevis]
MTEAGTGPPALSFPDSSIGADLQKSLEELTKAIEEKSDCAEYYCQRAYAHILLQNYNDAVLDAKRSLELQPNNASAFLSKGEAEFHLQNYSSAEESFRKGQILDTSTSTFPTWIKWCEKKLNVSTEGQSTNNPQTSLKYRHDWYQTESHIIITVMIKNVQKNNVHVQFSERELTVNMNLPSEENYSLKLHLRHVIIPEQSIFKVLSTKVEIKFKKSEAIRWETLEGKADNQVKHFNPDGVWRNCAEHQLDRCGQEESRSKPSR